MMVELITKILNKNDIKYELLYIDDFCIFDFSKNEYFLPGILAYDDRIKFDSMNVILKNIEYTNEEIEQIIEAFCQNADIFDETLTKIQKRKPIINEFNLKIRKLNNYQQQLLNEQKEIEMKLYTLDGNIRKTREK